MGNLLNTKVQLAEAEARIAEALARKVEAEARKVEAEAKITSQSQVWIYNCVVENAKSRKCCRYKVYHLAERHGAKTRVNASDGIEYEGNSDHLNVHLVFSREQACEEFQTELSEIPRTYRRKRKPIESPLYADITVKDEETIWARSDLQSLHRVRVRDYKKINGDPNPSEDCDTESVLSTESNASCVEMDDEKKLRLLDHPQSDMLRTHKPEKCHLLSRSSFSVYQSNPNNILFMSCFLHDAFDGTNQVNGVPDFALRFHSSNASSLSININGNVVQVFEVTVRAEFRSEEDRVTLTRYFKDYTLIAAQDNKHEVELMFYVQNAKEFEFFLTGKYEETKQKWEELCCRNSAVPGVA